MEQINRDEELQKSIEAQRGHYREFRPNFELEPKVGREISRTGRQIPTRDVASMDDLARAQCNPDSLLDLPPERPDFTGQNASGGQSNR